MSCARDILLFVLPSCAPTGLGPGADEAFVFTDVWDSRGVHSVLPTASPLTGPWGRGACNLGSLCLFSRLPVLLSLPGRQSDRHQLWRHYLVSIRLTLLASRPQL